MGTALVKPTTETPCPWDKLFEPSHLFSLSSCEKLQLNFLSMFRLSTLAAQQFLGILYRNMSLNAVSGSGLCCCMLSHLSAWFLLHWAEWENINFGDLMVVIQALGGRDHSDAVRGSMASSYSQGTLVSGKRINLSPLLRQHGTLSHGLGYWCWRPFVIILKERRNDISFF